MTDIYLLENEHISLEVNAIGAELCKLYSKTSQINYLWHAEPEFWARHSPVLFPIVGKLKNNTYHFEGEVYNLPQHGLARDLVFTCIEKTSNRLAFELKANENTLRQYPFHFSLIISYTLENNAVITHYEVKNNSSEKPMFFNLGAHPGFNLPNYESNLDDYRVVFEKDEQLYAYPLASGLLKEKSEVPFSQAPIRSFGITPELFANDALVFNNLHSSWVALVNAKTGYTVKVSIENFPWLGIWGKDKLPFLCLEPWCGHADFENHNLEFTQKADIISLLPLETWRNSYSITIH